MRSISFILVLLGILFASGSSYAASTRPVCFDITWESNGAEGGVEGKQADGTQYFVTINGSVMVGFDFDHSQFFNQNDKGKFLYSHSRGCVDASAFQIGPNNIAMSFVLANGSNIQVGWLRVQIVLKLPNGNFINVGSQLFEAHPDIKQWYFNKKFDATLRDIAPDVLAMTDQFEGEIQGKTQEIQAIDQTIDADLQSYATVFDGIKDKSFLELTEADFAAFLVAAERYKFLRNSINEKQEVIAQKTAVLKAVAASAKAQIATAIANEGLDINSSDILNLNPTIKLDPISSVDQSLAGQSYPYAGWADQTIQELQYLFDAGQRAQFLENALRWTLQTENLLRMVQARTSLSKEELNSFESATNRVNGFIFGVEGGKKGVLTKDFWFSDLEIDPSVREAIDGPLAERNPVAAQKLKAEINGLKTLTQSLINNLRAISELAQMYKAAQSEAEKSFIDKLVAGATNVIELAPEIAECIAKNVAAGPYADFYEFIYEEDFCTGKPNDEVDRLVAGVSLSIEAGSVLFSGPVGVWVVDKAELPVKFLKKSFSMVKSAAQAKAMAKLEKVGALFGSGIFMKSIKNKDEAKKLAHGVFESARDIGVATESQLKKLLDKSVGKKMGVIRAEGKVESEGAFTVFAKEVPINNPIPESGIFARIVPKDLADKIRKGELPLSRPNGGNEAFVTAFDDVRDISNPKDFAKRLSLYTDEAATTMLDTSNMVALKFRFNSEIAQSLRSPIELLEKRGFGFIPGGRTLGNAREWLIDNDAFQKGLIEFID